jgi:serine/threonine protein kinase/tetratricopeptide (TPR) repeat protein
VSHFDGGNPTGRPDDESVALLEPGRVLSHYRIIEKLGQGGQATAYKAEDMRLNRTVVVKILRQELAQSEAAKRRFEREACLCSALDNPNISAVFDVGETSGLNYIVMQYVDGSTLKALMGGRPLEPLSGLSIAIQIADALAVAHAAGIVHRDLKPSNVIVTPAGQAKVLDFGLAKMLAREAGSRREEDPLTETGTPYGSLGYGSPEQVSGQTVDHRSDIFSLGIVLYEMIAGQRPFKGATIADVLHSIVNSPPRPLTQFNPRSPARLQAILNRALAKEPQDRYRTMAALRDDLKALMRQLTLETGLVPTEATATLLVPQRARSTWLLGGTLGRVFGRRRRNAGSEAAARPASWGRETKQTIAVLPFRNISGDPHTAFYEFGLADGVITDLGQVGSLVVRPSSYIAPYVGQTVDPRQVGEELAVGFVLVGTFLKAGDRFRVTAQLISTATGEIQWSDKIDVAAPDLISLQDAIAARVIEGLRVEPTAEEQEKIERPLTRNTDAYEFYLRGRDQLFAYVLRTFDIADLERAIRMFNEAIGLDPEFAAAHTALGRCYIHHAQGYGGEEYYTLAHRALRRALSIDPASVEARLHMAHVDLHHGDKDGATAAIEQLRREAPDDPAVLYVAGMLYRLDGLYENALEAYDHVLRSNPQDLVIVAYNRARVLTHQRRYDQAVAELELARAVEPDHPLVRTFLAVALFNQGKVEEAQALMEDVLRHHPHLDGVRPVLAWCLSARGGHEKARELITDRVREIAAADHDIAFWLASFYGMEGMADDAVEWARRAVKLGNENYPLFADSRKLDPLRGDPRFQELLDELKRRWEDRARRR